MRPLLLIFLLLFLYCKNSHAQNKITFCYETWQPFAYVDDQGISKGEHITTINKAVKQINMAAEYIELPFMRCLQKVKSGKIDFMLHVDESSKINFINYPIGSWDLVIAYSNKISKSKKLQSIIISKGFHYPEPVLKKLEENFKDVIKESYYIGIENDVKRLFKLIESDFVDAMLIDQAWAKYELNKESFNVSLKETLFYSQPQYLGYINSRKSIAEKLHKALLYSSQKK